ncbi:hypothetical protein CEP52_013361 [Fusarium oligoseptatum]|uniref:Xanthine/uracil permease n=1 Tax=Fusarium oligoseptatum TaxID=2604345 RepID=A0A428STT4_9HYPO|nr:hypothetical protein CEP52_013361 [Fusarium oligoseptatum]
MGWMENTNRKIAASAVGRWFQLDGSGHPRERKGSAFFTEIRAGLATFFAMAYIIAVNSSIVSESGGTCVCNTFDDAGLCVPDDDYRLCVAGIKRDAVTATAAISALASFFMGLCSNLPVGLAPGMGLNAYFTYTVVGPNGNGPVPYEVALTAIFIEGFIFFGLALFGMRQWLARAIPRCIKLATSVGIGLFLTLIGLTYSEGIGLIVGATSTPMELAGCPEDTKVDGGAVIAGILLVSIISWPRDTPVTYFPYDAIGSDRFDFFKKVVDFHEIENTLNVLKFDISGYGGQFGLALITFLYVDILDCTGTLYGMARFANVVDPVTQDFEGSSIAYMVDALSISIGAVFGVPPVTAFVESGAVTEINWRYMGDAVPAFLTIAIMPFTYSIADGLIAGICTYMLINTVVWLIKLATGGRIVPPNYDERDGWTWRIPGGDFWREDPPAADTAPNQVTVPERETSSDHGGSEGKVAETTMPREKEI